MAGHHHHHAHAANNKPFIIAITANGLYAICQILSSYSANSTSLLADAAHNCGDVLSLVLAWIGAILSQRTPTQKSTYGLKKTSILVALANGLVLVFTCGMIVSEVVYKFITPESVDTGMVIVVAAIGVLVNGITATLFMRGRNDLNIRGAFIHLLYDALISLGVMVSAFLIYLTGWLWVDPVIGLIIAIIIIKSTWFLFTDSLHLIIDGVPRGILLKEVHELLQYQPGVRGVHDLHVWALSTQENALSVHLWMPEGHLTDEARQQLSKKLREEHNIHHITIQTEQSELGCGDICKPYL